MMSSDATAAEAARVENFRKFFDCSGTVWSTARPSDGRPVCHNMPIETGAPDISACKARIEWQESPGVFRTVPPGDVFDPFAISQQFLYELGGSRLYRVSLRFRGNTIRYSSLPFDLRAMGEGEQRPFPAEREEAAAPASAQAAAPAKGEVDSLLALGSSPVAALLGSVIATNSDPMVKLCFALLMEKADAAEKRRREEAQAAEDRRKEDLQRASATTTLVVNHLHSAFQAGAVSRPDLDSLREKLHAQELAAARASAAASPPPPIDPAKAQVIEVAGRVAEAVLSHGVGKLIDKVPPEAAAAVVQGAASMAAAA